MKKNVAEILLRKEPLTNTEWLALIETRRAQIKPYLDKFTLLMLGELGCLKGIPGKHGIADDAPKVKSPTRLKLGLQGIFMSQAPDKVKRFGLPRAAGCSIPWDGTLVIGGLDRSGHWIIAEVDFVGESGWKDRGYERATEVRIRQAELPEVLAEVQIKPREMMANLSGAVSEWTRRRQELAMQAASLARSMETEDVLLTQMMALTMPQ